MHTSRPSNVCIFFYAVIANNFFVLGFNDKINNHKNASDIENFIESSENINDAISNNVLVNKKHFNLNLNYYNNRTYKINDYTVNNSAFADDESINENATSNTNQKDNSNKLKSLSLISTQLLSTKHPEFNKNDKFNVEKSVILTTLKATIAPLKKIITDNNNSNYSTMKPTSTITQIHNHPVAPSSTKIHKTDAPMLNLVFDSYIASKHRHHDFRLGTHFDDVVAGSLINVTIQDGKTVHLNCKINLLQDKTVSWVRRVYDVENIENSDLQLLTVGMHTYTGDSRYSVDFQFPNNWRLQILNVNKRDEGYYECQLSTHPPKVIQYYVQVNAPEIMIIDEYNAPLYDKYYEVDSMLELTCIVRYITMTSSVVLWSHNDHVLNYDVTRGGISVKTDLTDEGANSTLYVAKINKQDSGNYTCSTGPNQYFTTNVHVLNESLAELYHGCSNSLIKYQTISPNILIMLTFLLILLSNLNNIHNRIMIR